MISKSVFSKPSALRRGIAAKLFGLVFGLLCVFLLGWLNLKLILVVQLGLILWCITLGALVAVFGVLNWQPFLKFNPPSWLSGAVVCGWMNFVLWMIGGDRMTFIGQGIFPTFGSLFLGIGFVAIGVVFGLVAGLLATLIGGEGPECCS